MFWCKPRSISAIWYLRRNMTGRRDAENQTIIIPLKFTCWSEMTAIGSCCCVVPEKRCILRGVRATIKFKIRCWKITMMGRTCLGWRARNRTLHFLCLSWTTGTCPASASLYPSDLPCLFYATWCPGTLLRSQQQKVPMRMARWSCHWTARGCNIMSFLKGQNQSSFQKSDQEGKKA